MQVLHKKKIMRMAAMLFAVMLMVSMLAIPAFAAEDLSGTGIAGDVTATAQPDPTDAPTLSDGTYNKWIHQWGLDKDENKVNIKHVTTDDVNNWVERKGNDVISIAQTTGKVLSFIGFFVSIIFVIIGAIGNRRTMTGGFIGMTVSACAYVALTYGKELVYLFSSWVVS